MLRAACAIALILPLLFTARIALPAEPPTLMAAASMTEVVTELTRQFTSKTNIAPRLIFAASSTLARQIDQGAPVQLYLTAHKRWLDWLSMRGHLIAGSETPIAGNTLVLLGRTSSENENDNAPEIALTQGQIRSLLADRAFSVADPTHVPAGLYAQQALLELGVWSDLKGQIVPARSVRDAVRYLNQGEVDFAIAYATDAAFADLAQIRGRFDAASHAPIRYMLALIKQPDRVTGVEQAAKRFYQFLLSPQAELTLRTFGFPQPAPG